MNKFEQVSSLGHQISLAGGPYTVRAHVQGWSLYSEVQCIMVMVTCHRLWSEWQTCKTATSLAGGNRNVSKRKNESWMISCTYLWNPHLIIIMTSSAFHVHACQSYNNSHFYLSFCIRQETMIKYIRSIWHFSKCSYHFQLRSSGSDSCTDWFNCQ